MFDHKHYVPILKAHTAEMAALVLLSVETRPLVTPLLEITPRVVPKKKDKPETAGTVEGAAPKKKSNKPPATNDSHFSQIVSRIASSWTTGRGPIVDTRLLPADYLKETTERPLKLLLDVLLQSRVAAIPAFSLQSDDAHLAIVRAFHLRDGRGACLRLSRADLSAPAMRRSILGALAEYGLKPAEVDLVIDLAFVRPEDVATLAKDGPTLISKIPAIEEWRSLTLAGGAFPSDLSAYGEGKVRLPRHDWVLWTRIVEAKGLPRVPRFGDYGTRHPASSVVIRSNPRSRATIKYTLKECWLMLRGSLDDGLDGVDELCRTLVSTDDYMNANHCEGDRYINDFDYELVKLRGHQKWIEVATSHHLTFVSHQVANYPSS